ncbi:hypothetical protein HanPSC8_Chr11g0459781 [Helianthus annuus]|nr:hypothetical protein HanPSC8_Chr11g0459781 [Helianthus annuus]
MFAHAICRRQLQMQVCATKVRATATFIAGMARWSTWKVDGDLDLDIHMDVNESNMILFDLRDLCALYDLV